SPQTFYHVLLWAASRQDTVEPACQVLTGVPSSNDVRYHLNQFEDMGLEFWAWGCGCIFA
ncbi:MAG: hypothetical protein AAFQ57_07155, partial [Cyanobacteria bacterium J06626_14]